MKNRVTAVIALFVLFAVLADPSQSQVRWVVGGNMGLSISTGGGASSTDFTFGPMAEVMFGKGPAVGTEFDITTATGTPITWVSYFKYYFQIPGSNIKPYAHAGFALVFVTAGPHVFIPFGGGASFGVAKNLYVSADLTLGPQFVSSPFPGFPGITVFNIAIRPGIRYEIP
ncbi:MAG: hypothetical protein KF749_13810 [Bacteroidetes bacterium]|nr:hypothetical protein [Bacteroidota bacterium]MCW5896273.1 hypothetical protein [Bacteroidota bacterium]